VITIISGFLSAPSIFLIISFLTLFLSDSPVSLLIKFSSVASNVDIHLCGTCSISVPYVKIILLKASYMFGFLLIGSLYLSGI
jgi:hypothetical protein